MASLQKTQVDLSGLLEVLGKNLYSTPLVALRELIQNSHDACTRHRIEAGSHRDYEIQVFTHPSENKLRIVDNGSGLTKAEIEQFLATIGAGYTRVLRQNEQSAEMIGYFGLGFLSAYVVADRVEVVTESYKEPDSAWHFVSNGGQRYSISPTNSRKSGSGSEVILHLKNDAQHLSDPGVLRSLLTKYCCLLPTQIVLNQDQNAINAEPAPWYHEGSSLQLHKKQMAFAQRFEQHFEPICTLPILSNELAVQGFLWIQSGSGYSTVDLRNVNVFVRHMHITSKAEDLLPRWAGFVGCLINADCLTPTASREDIQNDEAYEQLQDLLHRSLVDGLKTMPEKQAESWKRVLRRHNQALLGAAVADSTLFDSVKDDVTLPTSQGDMKVTHILKQAKQCLYVQPQQQLSYQGVLLSSQGIPIVSGYLFAATAFCQRYTSENSTDLVLMGHSDDNQKLFPVVQVDPEEKKILQALFCQSDSEKLVTTEFLPAHIPLVIMEDESARLKRSIESDEADKRIGSAILGLAREFTKKVDGTVERYIYINVKSQLIQSMLILSEEQGSIYAEMIRAYVLAMVGSTDHQEYTDSIEQYFVNLSKLINKQ